MPKKSHIPSLIIILPFLAMIAFFSLYALLDEDDTVSQYEGRPLASAPGFTPSAYLDGSFMRALESYFNDTFPRRTDLMKANQRMNYLYKLPLMKQDYYLTSDGKMLLYGNAGMELFDYQQEPIDYFALRLANYRSVLPEDVKISVLVLPTHSAFAAPEEFTGEQYDQKSALDYLYNKLDGITAVNSYDVLSQRYLLNDYLYFRTDHHWTALGAYYAYREFVGADNAVDLSSLNQITKKGFLGSMFNFTSQIPQNSVLSANPDDIIYYEQPQNASVIYYSSAEMTDPTRIHLQSPADEDEASYSVFLGSDHALTKIESSIGNGKTILVIKDSYANAFLPWLTNNYETVWVIDPRYFVGEDKPKISVIEFVDTHEIKEVLFVNYAMVLKNKDWAGMIKEIL